MTILNSPHESLVCPPDMVTGIIADSYAKSLVEKLRASCEKSLENVADEKPKVGIIGAGLMGTAIAAAHLRCGVELVLFDTQSEPLKTARGRIASELAQQGDNNDCIDSNLTLIDSFEKLADCDILIETIPEKIKAKQKLYRQLNEVLENRSIYKKPLLFSNTSTISITQLIPVDSEEVYDSTRFCGFHFFHPVRERSLLEIIPGNGTAPETVDSAVRHALRIDKLPIIVKDSPGFLVNRLLHPYLNEALVLLAEGVDIMRIEEVAGRFGMAMGPFRIIDEIGLDVTLSSGWVLAKAYPERVKHSPVLLKLLDLKRLGRKSGRGFFIYTGTTLWSELGKRDPELESILGCEVPEKWISDEEIARRLFLGIYLEGLRILEDGVVDSPEAVDTALLLGLGFPSNRGGIFHWANSIGNERVMEMAHEVGLVFRS